METLTKLKTKKGVNIPKKFFVLDIETNGLEATAEKFKFACIYGHNFCKFFYSVEETIKFIFSGKLKNKILYAHNAEFDLMVLFGNLFEYFGNPVYAGSRLIVAEKKEVKFADSLNILLMSAKKVGSAIGLEKLDIENEYIQGNVTDITDKMREYCKRDCEIIYTALLRVFLKVGAVRLTVASLAMAYFRNRFLPFEIKFERSLTNEFFNSYYGGRVEAFKIGSCLANKYDVNSEYPFVMVNTVFPNPEKLIKKIKPEIKFLLYAIKNFEGCAKVTVLHKDTYFGFLPHKNKEGKLLFPIGKFSGCWNFNELRFAIEQGAIEILKCEYIVYSQCLYSSPFVEYVNFNYEEKKSGETDFDILLAKLMLNGLYGKFAEQIKYEQVYLKEIDFDFIEKMEKKNRFVSLSIFNKERKDCFVTLKRKENLEIPHAIASFSSYITSAARVYLLKTMIENYDKEIVYCDTDSIFCNKEIDFVNNGNLGEWKKEKEKVIEINGCKNYIYTDSKKIINHIKEFNYITEKIKGIPKDANFNNGEYFYKNLVKSKLGLRRQKLITGKLIEFQKSIKKKYDKRILIDEQGNTKPIKLK